MPQTFGFKPERTNRERFGQAVQGDPLPLWGPWPRSSDVCCGYCRSLLFSHLRSSLLSDEGNHRVDLNDMVRDRSSGAACRAGEQQWSREVFGWNQKAANSLGQLVERKCLFATFFSSFPVSTLEALLCQCGSHQHIKEFELFGGCGNTLVFTHQRNFTSE